MSASGSTSLTPTPKGPLSSSSSAPHHGFRSNRSLRDFLIVVFKRRWTIVGFFFATVVTAFLGIVLGERTYEVTAAMLVQKARAELPFVPSALTEPIVLEISEEDLNSEIEILRSRALLREVVRDLGSSTGGSGPSLVDRAKGLVKTALGMPQVSGEDARILGIENDLSIGTIPRSNVIELRYESPDPDRGERVLTALIDRYLGQRVEVHQMPEEVAFFNAQREVARTRLDSTEAAVEQYVRDTGLSLPHEGQREIALGRLDQFERLLAEATVEVRQGEERVSVLLDRVGLEPARMETAYRLNSDAESEEIRRSLVQLRSRRDDLLTRGYSATNPRVTDLDAQILLAEGRLVDAEARAGEISGTEANPVHQDLRSQLLTAQADLQGARGRRATLEAQVRYFRAELDTLNARSFEATRLLREASAAEETYLLYDRKAEEARIASAVEGARRVNVTVARPPEHPLEPSGPSATMLLALALMVGSVGGVSLAYLRELVDQTFTTGEDIERLLGIPYLASIPDSHLVSHSEPPIRTSADG